MIDRRIEQYTGMAKGGCWTIIDRREEQYCQRSLTKKGSSSHSKEFVVGSCQKLQCYVILYK